MTTTVRTPSTTPCIEAPPPSFEASLGELENIVSLMESGQLPLQKALDAYQRGNQLLQHCQATLTSAEQQINMLEPATSVALPASPTATSANQEN